MPQAVTYHALEPSSCVVACIFRHQNKVISRADVYDVIHRHDMRRLWSHKTRLYLVLFITSVLDAILILSQYLQHLAIPTGVPIGYTLRNYRCSSPNRIEPLSKTSKRSGGTASRKKNHVTGSIALAMSSCFWWFISIDIRILLKRVWSEFYK